MTSKTVFVALVVHVKNSKELPHFQVLEKVACAHIFSSLGVILAAKWGDAACLAINFKHPTAYRDVH